MVKVTTIKPFYDLVEHKDRAEGEVFDATEERAAYIDAALPGYIAIEKPEEPDLTKMTVPQLFELAKERDIKFKGRPSKAQLIEALTKE